MLRTSLTNATMTGANLSYTNLALSDLQGVNLVNANLPSVTLSSADLTDATFSYNTILWHDKTVEGYGFDVAGLQNYLIERKQAASVSGITIIPEPSTASLLACLGFLLVSGRSRRR